MTTERLDLPSDFTFGTATASYQIEGGATEGGRGRSIWDDFCDEPGRITDGSSGAVACDHYHRMPEDVELMAGLGTDAYRFSFAWPRIQPDGTGAANAEGLDFYDRLIDALCDKGIAPVATLFHWDLPSALQAGGGWLNRDTTERFAAYTQVMADRFADRVALWLPVNEPVVVTMFGHALGRHAPGLALGLESLAAAHHLLLGHGRAVEVLRASGARAVGCVNNHTVVSPASDSADDAEAAALYDTIHNRMFADPMLLGSYPEPFASLLPGPVDDDLKVISAPLDAYGLNYYNPTSVAASDGSPETGGLPFKLIDIEGYPLTDFGWPVVPAGLTATLVQLKERYGDRLPPVHVTENGCSYAVGPGDDGAVHDTERIAYLDGHLRAVADARAQGVDVRGYYCWSLLDNFEWAEGFTQRFGLVHVDYDTLTRTPKDSYGWYRDTITATRAPDGLC